MEVVRINGFAETHQVDSLENLIDAGGETALQCLIGSAPALLAPLELAEVVRHLRYPKRNVIDPTASLKSSSVRIPDFDGIRLVPFQTPIVIELKAANVPILDQSSGRLSATSLEVCNQLREGFVHLVRAEGQSLRRSVFGMALDDVLDKTAMEELTRNGGLERILSDEKSLTDLMKRLIDLGCGFIAVIGRIREFRHRPELLSHARSAFIDLGCLLVTFDDALSQKTC